MIKMDDLIRKLLREMFQECHDMLDRDNKFPLSLKKKKKKFDKFPLSKFEL